MCNWKIRAENVVLNLFHPDMTAEEKGAVHAHVVQCDECQEAQKQARKDLKKLMSKCSTGDAWVI